MSDPEAPATDASLGDPSPDPVTDDQPVGEPSDEPGDGPSDEPGDGPDEGSEPSWWHRSHPTFAGLLGFFCGVAYVIVVPGVYAALLGLLVSDTTAQKLFPLVLLALIVPLVLLIPRKTRRFAQFAFLGILLTILVVAVTSALVIWVMVKLVG